MLLLCVSVCAQYVLNVFFVLIDNYLGKMKEKSQ